MQKFYLFFLLMAFGLLVGCQKDSAEETGLPEAILEVTPADMVFDETDASKNCFVISANTDWEATPSDSRVKLDKNSGEAGDHQIMVKDMPSGESCTVVITTQKRNESDRIASRTVILTRKEKGESSFVGETIYSDNLDKAQWTGSGDPYLDQWNGYINATGTGAADVTYSGISVSIRSSFPSSGYTNSSGKNAFYFGVADAQVTIGNIALKPEHKNLKLTFGCCKYSGNFDVTSNIQLFMGGDGSSQVPVSYTRSTTNDWALATAVFTLTEVPEKLTIRFVSDDYNIRMDDITLTTTDQTPTQSITFPKVMNYPWAELPVKVENADYKYITHYAETIRTKQRVRNYTTCYDIRRHNPLWVAYPNHACYQEGGYARTKPDPWRPDPQLTTDQQSVIYGKDWAAWPWSASGGESKDLYQYWTLFNGISFTRGHLLASANRGGAGSELNMQTFQASNIAPEEYLYEEHWDSVEIMLSDYWTCADTIYVVAGCYYGDDSKTCYDAASWNNHSALSKQCVIPEARYKVFLRTKSGSTGKNIAQCTADELMAIGVWFPQNLDGRTPAYTPPLSDYVMSVAEIERKLGGAISFFPSAPAGVKETYNIFDWPEWSK